MAGLARLVGGCLVHRKVAGSFQVRAQTGFQAPSPLEGAQEAAT